MKWLLFFTLVFAASNARTQSSNQGDRKELYDLLSDRKQKFDSYSVLIERRSGIFGNQTKSDIKSSNEVLMEIVRTDNKIISTLNRVVDFRNYERVTMNYDLRERDEKLNSIQVATDTLSKRVDVLTEVNKTLKRKLMRTKLFLYVFGITSLALLVLIVRKKN